jgi:SprT protein
VERNVERREAAEQLLFSEIAMRPLSKLRSGRDASLEEVARNLLTHVGCPDLAPVVQVTWNPRLRSTAGRAFHGRRGELHASPWRVELNPLLGHFGSREVDKTLRHELAHLVAHRRAARRRIEAHGQEWRVACADLGIPDETVTHHLPLPRREVRKPHRYLCSHCRMEVRRVRPFRRPSACGHCCGRFSKGQFDPRFLLRKAPVLERPPGS